MLGYHTKASRTPRISNWHLLNAYLFQHVALSGLFLDVLTVHIHCPYPGFAHSSTPKPVAREKTGALWDLAVRRDQWVSQQRWVRQERKDGWSRRVAKSVSLHDQHGMQNMKNSRVSSEITRKHESIDRRVHVRLLRVWLPCCFADLRQAVRVQQTWHMRYLWHLVAIFAWRWESYRLSQTAACWLKDACISLG